MKIVMTGDPNQPARAVRSNWPGVAGVLSLDYTCSHGITPGVGFMFQATVTC